jgi:hypothetical protein
MSAISSQYQVSGDIRFDGSFQFQTGGSGDFLHCWVGNKSCVAKPAEHYEIEAYLSLRYTPLQCSIPRFFGCFRSSSRLDLIISDITEGFQYPCIADLKIGYRHYDLKCSEKARMKTINRQKSSTTETIQIRIVDLIIRNCEIICHRIDRDAGLMISPDDFSKEINSFIPQHLKCHFRNRIQNLYTCYEATLKLHPGFRMYGGSILVCYDSQYPTEIRVNLIDLAHTHIDIRTLECDINDPIYDDGVLYGIQMLLQMINV